MLPDIQLQPGQALGAGQIGAPAILGHCQARGRQGSSRIGPARLVQGRRRGLGCRGMIGLSSLGGRRKRRRIGQGCGRVGRVGRSARPIPDPADLPQAGQADITGLDGAPQIGRNPGDRHALGGAGCQLVILRVRPCVGPDRRGYPDRVVLGRQAIADRLAHGVRVAHAHAQGDVGKAHAALPQGDHLVQLLARPTRGIDGRPRDQPLAQQLKPLAGSRHGAAQAFCGLSRRHPLAVQAQQLGFLGGGPVMG